MKILYLHQYFRTPVEGGALRSYYLSQALIQAGHEVELITAYNGEVYKISQVEGVTVHYLPIAYRNDFGFLARILAFLKFSVKSIWLAFKLKNIDLCFATSTPLTVGLPALLLKKFRKVPYYFEVRDLWPEAPIQLGVIQNSFLKTVLIWFEKLLYKNAEKIIALSPGMVAGIQKYNLQKPVYLIPNIADCQFYQPAYSERTDSNEPFIISYLGTLGRANRVEYLLNVAKVCLEARLNQVQFIIAGTGADAEKLKAFVKDQNLVNVQFAGQLTRAEIAGLLQRSHATYTSFDQIPVLETNSPNKFFDSLAAGKLTIVNTQGWLQELVAQNACGFYADPEKPSVFVQQLLPFLTDNNHLRTYQQNARKLAETEFSRELLSRKFIQLFRNL